MKRMNQYIALLVGLLLLSCSDTKEEAGQSTIRVAEAMENLQELKVSQLGSKIRYVPLETNDSVLVANRWRLSVTDRYAIVSNLGSSQKCMTFDLNTGKYIATVGHRGQDPEAYASSVPILDGTGNDQLYFLAPKRLVKYSVDNRFLGSIEMNHALNSFPFICDTVMIEAYTGNTKRTGRYISLLQMNLEGDVIDSTIVVKAEKQPGVNGEYYFNARINVSYGLMPHGGMEYRKIMGELEGSGNVVAFRGSDQMWQIDGAVRFRQAFNDSIYVLDAEGARVAYLFDTGKWHYSIEDAEVTPGHVFITDVTETPDKIIFAASKGWFREGNKGYVGLYDKKAGTTVMGAIENGFRDDLAGFAPFYPIRTNGKGQLIGVMTVEEIAKWLEKQPDAEIPAALDTLAEDANPVLVIVE